ncbi:MAG: protein-glutamate O-methyltransferase CheR [Planctomycetes bacterium]|nr:protein-glutamate O-methyltransferase CheR [Planctomycetota bacterium]
MIDSPVGFDPAELDTLLAGIRDRYGYDFREYAPASLARRIRSQMGTDPLPALSDRLLQDPEAFGRFLDELAVHSTSMFRDPGFWRSLRANVLPHLATWPFIRIWCVGCSTGEEAWSLAILLEEEGLLARSRIYATDLSERVLERARRGVFPLSAMKEYTENYLASRGTRAFSDYYSAGYDKAIFRGDLVRQAVFAQHNLATDGAFQEFHLVLCRNVLIYFGASLSERVHRLLFESLAFTGVLALGLRETIERTPLADRYDPLDAGQRIYRKARP